MPEPTEPDPRRRPRPNVEDEAWGRERRAEAAGAVKALSRNGWPIGHVAALLGLSTRAVRRYLAGAG